MTHELDNLTDADLYAEHGEERTTAEPAMLAATRAVRLERDDGLAMAEVASWAKRRTGSGTEQDAAAELIHALVQIAAALAEELDEAEPHRADEVLQSLDVVTHLGD